MVATIALKARDFALLLLMLAPSVFAEGPVAPPLLEFASGLPGKQVRLSWAGQVGVRYAIEKSTTLATGGTGGWKQVALVEASGPELVWLDPEPTTLKAFYRVSQPTLGVFSISPPVLSTTGGTLVVHGQYIPAGSFLVIHVQGQAPVIVPLSSLGNGEWQAMVSGTFTAGGEVAAVSIQDGSGVTLLTLNQPIEITSTGLASDSPPSLPPAAPVSAGRIPPIRNLGSSGEDGVEIKLPPDRRGSALSKGKSKGPRIATYDLKTNKAGRMAGGVDEDCDDLGDDDLPSALGMAIKTKGTGAAHGFADSGSSLLAIWASKKGYEYYKAKSDMSAAGAVNNPYFQDNQNAGEMPNLRRGPKHPDLMKREIGPGAISPAPSGLPGEVSFQSCDLSLPCPAGPPLEWVCTYRSKFPVSSGHGPGWDFSYNIWIEASDSSASRVVVHDGGGRSDVFHRQTDGTYRCDGMFREGRFDGDVFTLTFADKGTWTFNPLGSAPHAGKISSITDRNGVGLTCAYDSSGQLASVADAFGRSLAVEWDGDSPPRIVSVTAASVSLNFTKITYTYSTPERMRTTASAPFVPGEAAVAGPTTYAYASGTGDPRLDDNLVSITDGAGRELLTFTYTSTPAPTTATDYDICASRTHKKTGHVSLLKRGESPSNSSSASAYTDFEIDEIGRLTETDCDRQHRVLAVREFTGFCTPGVPVTATSNRPVGKLHASDPDYFETTCAYNADSLPTRVTHPDGSQELVTYDRDFRNDCPVRERGNARVTSLRSSGGEVRTVTCDYLPDFGSPESACAGNPIRVKDCNDRGGDVVAKVRHGGVITGTVVINNGNLRVSAGGGSSKEEGGRHTPFHNRSSIAGITGGAIAGIVVAGVCAAGEDEDCDGTTDDMDFASGSSRTIGVKQKAWMCANFRIRMVSAYGQVSTCGYDEHGNLTSSLSPVSGRGSLFEYNIYGQLTSCSVLNGADSPLVTTISYGENNFPASVIEDGSGLHLATHFGCDAQGRVTSVTDPNGNSWLFGYNPLDQCVQTQSPEMPNRISVNVSIDSGGQVARCDVENRGSDGSLDAANPVFSTFFVYDDRCNLIQIAREERPVNSPPGALAPEPLDLASYDVCDITLDNAGQAIRVSTPAACRGQTTDLVCDFTYNERGMLDRCIEGGLGTPGAVTTAYEYDLVGATVRRAILGDTPDGSPQTLISYDGFHRVSSITDPMGNVTQYAYGNDGSVATSVHGELDDQPGSENNVLVARYTSRRRVEVLKSNRTASPDFQKPDKVIMCTFDAPFFFVETEDDTLTVERFTPGSTAPPVIEVTTIDRSPAGLVQSVTCNGDLLLSCTYDTAWRGIACADGSCTVALTLDACGHTTSLVRTDISGVPGVESKTFTRAFVIDSLGRVTECTEGTGNVTSIAYDSLSRPVSITEPGRPPRFYAYDGVSAAGAGTLGAPFSVQVSCDLSSSGSPQVLSSALVRCGACVSTTDANGYSRAFAYDSIGRLTQCDFPDETSQAVAFNAIGQLVSASFPDGTTQQRACDLNGRVISVMWSLPPAPTSIVAVPPTSYVYDGLGNLRSCVQGASVVTATYDSCGDQTSETQDGLTVTRTFNHRGRTGITYPDGSHFNESRNALGQLLAVTNSLGGNVVTMGYAGHRVVRSTQGNGVVSTWAYRGDTDEGPPGSEDFSFDDCVRATVSNAASVLLSDERTFRDRSQQTIRFENRFAGGVQAPYRSKAITRDGLGRITACLTERREITNGAIVPESSVSYVLATDGSRISTTGGEHPGAYSQSADLPPGDLQMGQYSMWPGGDLTWDANGNIGTFHNGTSELTFVHDAAGRLVSVDDPGTGPVITYAYDACGRRVGRNPQTGGTLSRFVHDGPVCIQELGADNLADMTFVCADGIRQCISTRNGTIYYPHGGGSSSDSHKKIQSWVKDCYDKSRSSVGTSGAVSLITSATGTTVERFACDDACKPIFLTGDGLPGTATFSSIGLRWMAPECAWEPEIGMIQCPGGIYSPDLGRAISSSGKKEFKGHVTLLK